VEKSNGRKKAEDAEYLIPVYVAFCYFAPILFMIVDIHIPCYVDRYFPDTAMNMVKVLERTGCAVNYNVEQTCCGMPAFYDGFQNECKEAGTKLIHEFQNDRYIVSCGAACTDTIKNLYPEMFHNSMLHNEYKNVQKKIFEFSDFLVTVMKVTGFDVTLKAKAVYMEPCMALHSLKNRNAPRILLGNIKELELIESRDEADCCGWSGTLAARHEELAVEFAKKKTEWITKTGVDLVISCEMGCLMHLDGYFRKNKIPVQVKHIADILAGCNA